MGYLCHEFQARDGDVVEVVLDRQAFVRLLDLGNFNNYKSGQRYQYIGGRAIASPVRIRVPSNGMWFTVIDFNGGGGTIRYAVRLLRRR